MPLIVLAASELFLIVALVLAVKNRRISMGLGASLELAKHPVLFILVSVFLVAAIGFVTIALVAICFSR